MKKFLVITGLALSLVGANAFAQATIVKQGATKVAPRTGTTAPKVAPRVKAPTAKVNTRVAAPVVSSGAVKPNSGVQSGSAPAVQIGSAKRAAPVAAKQDGAVCIGGKNFSSSCGSFTTNESISLVKQMIDTESTPAEISATLAKAQGISASEAQGKVAKLMQAGCITKN